MLPDAGGSIYRHLLSTIPRFRAQTDSLPTNDPCYKLHLVRQPGQKGTVLGTGFGGSFLDMKREPSLKQILAVRCPTCGAAPGKRCELTTGQPRTEPHRDRRLIAKD